MCPGHGVGVDQQDKDLLRGSPGNFCWALVGDRGLSQGALFALLQEGLLREKPKLQKAKSRDGKRPTCEDTPLPNLLVHGLFSPTGQEIPFHIVGVRLSSFIFKRSKAQEDIKCSSVVKLEAVSYTHLTLPTRIYPCRSRWSPYH